LAGKERRISYYSIDDLTLFEGRTPAERRRFASEDGVHRIRSSIELYTIKYKLIAYDISSKMLLFAGIIVEKEDCNENDSPGAYGEEIFAHKIFAQWRRPAGIHTKYSTYACEKRTYHLFSKEPLMDYSALLSL
jgi:hypothetical protein